MKKDNFFKDLSPLAKNVIVIGGMAIVGFVIYKVYKKFSEKTAEKPFEKVSDQAGQSVSDLVKQGMKLSFPSANYSATANNIQKLLDGCERTPSELRIVEDIIKVVKNKLDWFYLVKVFGVRELDNCGLGTGSDKYDLITLLKDQLDGTLIGDTVNGKRYWNVNSLTPLTEYLAKIGVSI